MPTYSLWCPEGHETKRFRKNVADRNDPTECDTCGAEAKRDGVRGTHKYPNPHDPTPEPKNRDGIGLSLHDFFCDACQHRDENVVIDAEEGETTSNHACSQCGETARVLLQAKIDKTLSRYPYYDDGAGRWFEKPEDRKRWMREAGVTEIGMDPEKLAQMVRDNAAARDAEAEADMAAYRADLRYYEEHPNPEIRKVYDGIKTEGAGRIFDGKFRDNDVNLEAEVFTG